jgi:GntR family phosphonate transport system transcriptional regulator
MSVSGFTRSGGPPLYRQVADRLEAEIRDHFQSGDRLPNEDELAERYGVHRHTLRRAIDELADAGLIERRHGTGTFVLGGVVSYPLSGRSRFTETLSAIGRATDTRVLRKQRLPGEGGVADRLAIVPGTTVTWVETLRQVDGAPFCIISHFLPGPWGEAVAEGYEGGSLHAFLRQHFPELRLRRAETLLTTTLPLGDDAKLLAMARHLPVLRAKTVNLCAATATPVEYALTRFRGDRAQLRLDFPATEE